MKPVIIIAIAFVFLFSSASIYAQTQYDIPAWFKGVAGFWAEDKISDNEFGEGVTFLIDSGIIKVPKIQELENKIAQLEDENAELRKIKGIPRPELTPTPTIPPTSVSINIQTDSSNYDEGDIVVVSGNVSIIIGTTLVTFQLFLDESLVDIAQIRVAQDGTFSHTIIAEGSLWKKTGDYLVRVSYGEGNIAETEFSYSPKTNIPEITTIFEVDAGSNGTFDVEYSIKGGTVKDMMLDYNIFAINVQIESTDKGTITLDLPREFIGAEKQDGRDDTFIVLLDGIEVAYRESVWDFTSRIITIDFKKGTSDIEIIGTYVLGTPSCDPSYPDVCIPPYPPDLDCDKIYYSNFRVIQPDPHGFDTDYDGIGCEVGSPQSSNPVESTPSCDPSYPDVCIPPYPPDLDCGEIGYSNFRVVGDDPHGFDRDNDGIGCES